MNEAHTTSLALSQRLKALGIPQVSEYCWAKFEGKITSLIPTSVAKSYENTVCEWWVSAFLADELGEMLPRYLFVARLGTQKEWVCDRWSNGEKPIAGREIERQYADTMSEALGLMLEYLKKEGLI